jgi:hypothetical protein
MNHDFQINSIIQLLNDTKWTFFIDSYTQTTCIINNFKNLGGLLRIMLNFKT